MATLIISEKDSSLNALIKALGASLDASSCTIYTGRPEDPNYVGISQICEDFDSTIQIVPPEEMFLFPGKKNIALVKPNLANDELHYIKKFDSILNLDRPINSAEYIKHQELFTHKKEKLRLYYEEDENVFEVLKTFYSEFIKEESVILYYVGDNYEDHAKYIKKILGKNDYPYTMVFNNANYTNKVEILKNSNATITENEETFFYKKPLVKINEMRDAWLSLKDFTTINSRKFLETNEIIERIKCALEM
jgi:hypothetical protein